ncbi:MAG: hypothetical protein ACJASR_002041 [Psychroserpens sp.]|jgi:hypothetical protein
MDNFYYRTESIHKDQLLNLFVESPIEREIINSFKSQSHIVLEGSRGSGKSFLMKVAQTEITNDFDNHPIMPVYVTFMQSALIHSSEPNQFYHWMLAKIVRETLKVLQKSGLVVSDYANSLLGTTEKNNLQEIVSKFEESYKKPYTGIDVDTLPELSEVIDAIEEICDENSVTRMVFFFDESAHVFRPEQQRQFFTLFRDFKSPYISCNAAVYPGVTHYGSSFEMTHDAIFKRIDRDLLSVNYVVEMEEMVLKQGGEVWAKSIKSQKELFNTLVFCAGGNPRLLLKTLDKCGKFNSASVNEVIRNFYRSDIWLEHTQLGEKYKGHKSIVDWGRSFIEDNVIPATISKNQERKSRGKSESTLYFWVSKDAPEQVKEALRLLNYTGIIRKYDSGVKATKSNIGDRFEIKFGCLISQYTSPISNSKEIISNVKLDMFTEYGQNNTSYSSLSISDIADFSDEEFLTSLQDQLNKPIYELDLTSWQKNKLSEINITRISDLLDATEEDLIAKLHQVGPIRARTMKNSATAELLESISG